MAKVSALTTTVSVDDSGGTARDISSDCRSVDFDFPRAEMDVTGLDKSNMERLLLRGDWTGTLNGIFNPATNMSHDVFKTVATQAGTLQRTVTIGFSTGGTVTGECVLTNYQHSIGEDGSHTWSVPFALANGTAAAWS